MDTNTAFLFVNCTNYGSQLTIEDRVKSTSTKISLQVQILNNISGDSNFPSFFCFICFYPREINFTQQQRLDCFEGVKTFVVENVENVKEVKYVEFTKEKCGNTTEEKAKVHKFLQPQEMKDYIKDKVISSQSIGVRSSFDLQKSFPNKKMLHFRVSALETVDKLSSVRLHDKTTLSTFYRNYLKKANTELITIPDFDRIEITKLYPLSPNQDKLDDFNCPGLHPGPSLYDYVGEIEHFWTHFHVWFPDPKGVLMHSYSQSELLSLLQNGNIFSFEFDWLYWMEDKVIVFEVALGKRPIGPKLDQVFNRHFTILRILFYFFSSIKSEHDFRTFFKQRVRFVIFFAGIDHEHLAGQVNAAIKGKKNDDELLDILYFVGNSSSKYSETPFFRFDRTHQKMIPCAAESVHLTQDDRFALKQLMSLFALGYFTNANDSVLQPFRQSPELIDTRFKKKQEQFWNQYLKGQSLNSNKFLAKLDVILSPQQFEILLENPKFLLCPAESGSGKTQLLLAKGLQSCMEESVHTVYFCVPIPRGETNWKRESLLEIVHDFAKRNEKDLAMKFQIICDRQLLNLRNKTILELKSSVLLIDEFHYDYEESFSITKEKFHDLAIEVFPYLINCWLANVTMHYLHKPNETLSRFIPPEFLCTRPLNVQFRSAKHISEFCSNFVQMYRSGKFSSPRVCGTFLSKGQQKVQICEFRKFGTASEEVSLNFPSRLSQSYNKNRWVIVLCNSEYRRTWENFFSKRSKDEFSGSKIVSFEDGFASCHFTGGEVQSLLLIIGGPGDDVYNKDMVKYNDMIVLASSRAQFELFIFVREDLRYLIKNLNSCAIAGKSLKVEGNNDLFRDQIVKFCKSLNHLNAENKFSSPRDHKFNSSKIHQVLELRKFKKNVDGSVDVNLNFPEIRFQSYKTSRCAVFLCNDDARIFWEKFVNEKLYEKVSNAKILDLEEELTSRIRKTQSRQPIRKTQSIFLIIDGPTDDLYEKDKNNYKQMISLVASAAEYELAIYVRNDLRAVQSTLHACAMDVLDGSNEAIQFFLKHIELNLPTEKDVKTLVQKCNTSYATLNFVTEDFRRKAKIFVLCDEKKKIKWSNTLEKTFGRDLLGRSFQNDFHHDVSKVATGITYKACKRRTIVLFIDKSETEVFYKQKIQQFKTYFEELFSSAERKLFVYLRDDLTFLFTELQKLTKKYQRDVKVTLASFCQQNPPKPDSFYPLKFKSFEKSNEKMKIEQLTPFLMGSTISAKNKYNNRQILLLLGVKRASFLLKYLLSSRSDRKPQHIFRG